MNKSTFIKAAQITDIGALRDATPSTECVVLSQVLPNDHCFLVRSGQSLQFWIVREGQLLPVKSRQSSVFCLVKKS